MFIRKFTVNHSIREIFLIDMAVRHKITGLKKKQSKLHFTANDGQGYLIRITKKSTNII